MATDLKSDEQAQNELNIKLHAQPWYQAFLAKHGQNPQKVKLSGDQRTELQALAAQNGVTLPKGVQFDPSGNVNEQHGFAGQPGWAKAIEIGGALAAGGYFAAPLFAGATPALGAGEASTTLGATGGIVPGLATASALPTALGTTGAIASAVKPGLSTIDRVANILGAGGKAVGDATTAAGNNRIDADTAARLAAHQNVTDKAAQETAQRSQADADRQAIYRYNVANNPVNSPNNPRPQTISPEMLAGLSDMEKQALMRVQAGPAPYVPYQPKPASTLEQIGNYASPIMSTIGTISKYL